MYRHSPDRPNKQTLGRNRARPSNYGKGPSCKRVCGLLLTVLLERFTNQPTNQPTNQVSDEPPPPSPKTRQSQASLHARRLRDVDAAFALSFAARRKFCRALSRASMSLMSSLSAPLSLPSAPCLLTPIGLRFSSPSLALEAPPPPRLPPLSLPLLTLASAPAGESCPLLLPSPAADVEFPLSHALGDAGGLASDPPDLA